MAVSVSLSSGRFTRRLRRPVVVAVVLGVIAGYGLVSPSVAEAASVPGSNFEIDSSANLVVDGPPPAIDWLAGGSGTPMRPKVVVRDDLPSGSTDDSFTQGTKEDSLVPTLTYSSVPPNKNDLTHFGIYLERQPSANFVNVFFTRAATKGDANVDFEFNQSANRANNPSTFPQEVPVRTPGDILITYDFTVGGSSLLLQRRTWTGTVWGPPTTLGPAQAIGSINTAPIAAIDAGGLGDLAPLTFGEVSINLAAFVPDQSTCTTYGSVYVKSRSSGSSFDSELQDFVAPEPVTISNCGAVSIHKTDSNGPLQGAGFTAYQDVAPYGGSRDAGDTTVVGTCTTDASGNCTIPDLHLGHYWVVETTVPPGHDPVPDQAVEITSAEQVVSLNLDDPIQYGHLVVIKHAVPQDGQAFSFTLDGAPFSLTDNGTSSPPNTRTFTVVAGTHTLTELATPGWTNTDLVCVDPTADTTTARPNATVRVAKDETVTCTYTNTFTLLNPHLTTQAAPVTANTSWNDVASLTGDGTHPLTGIVTFFACAPQPTATACTSGGTQVGSPVPVAGGPTTYAATTSVPWTPSDAGWTCLRAEFASTSAFYDGSTHTNATSECFLKRWDNLTVSKTAVATYGRAYHWTIAKVANATRFEIPQGGTAHITYTVTVGNTHTDSAWTVAGKITVTNPNPVDLSGVSVTDAINNGAGTCAVAGGAAVTVPAHGTTVLDYVCAYTAAPSPPQGVNTATATWDASRYFTTSSTASGTASIDFSAVSPTTTDAVVTVTDPMGGGVLGTVNALTAANPATFTYSVDKAGTAGACTTYDNTATFTTSDTQTTGSASRSVDVCVGKDLVVSKTVTATYDRTYHWLITKGVRGSAVRHVPAGTVPSFTYDVTVSPNGFSDSNLAMSGTIHVVNPNSWEDIVTTVTDVSDVGGGVSCTVVNGTNRTVPKGSSLDLPYTCSFTGRPSDTGLNTATATWDPAVAHTPDGTASGSASVAFHVVTETNKTITVSDDKATPHTLGQVTYDGNPHTFTYTRDVPGTPGTCASDTNTASIVETGQSASQTVTVCVGLDLRVSKTALATDHRTYLWSIGKDVDKTRVTINTNGSATFTYTVTATPNGLTKDGWSVTGHVTVTNPNDWEDVPVDLTDSLNTGGGSSCTFPGGTHVTVPRTSTQSYDYLCSFASQPADGTNTATATWDKTAAATPTGTATGTASVVFVPTSETNKTVTVIDDKTDPAHPVVLGNATWGSTPTSFTYSITKTGVAGTCTSYTNTASVIPALQVAQLVLAAQQVLGTASKTVTVCVGQPLSTQLSSAASLDRAFNWLIDKAVDRTTVTLGSGPASFAYTVTVRPNGIVDSGYGMGGSVTVANPNDWEDLTGDVTVTSDVGGGVVCTVSGGHVTVPKGAQLTLPYTCSFTGVPALSGTTTATSAWDAAAASTAASSSSAAVPVAFAVNGNTHRTITVTDDKTDPANPVQLGTATYDDGVKAFTYSLTKDGIPSGCASYTNIATIVETGQTGSQKVALCHVFTGGGGGPTLTPPQGSTLPFTGDGIGLMVREAIGLILSGLLLLELTRRRRQA